MASGMYLNGLISEFRMDGGSRSCCHIRGKKACNVRQGFHVPTWCALFVCESKKRFLVNCLSFCRNLGWFYGQTCPTNKLLFTCIDKGDDDKYSGPKESKELKDKRKKASKEKKLSLAFAVFYAILPNPLLYPTTSLIIFYFTQKLMES